MDRYGLGELLEKSDGLNTLFANAVARIENRIMIGPLDAYAGGDLAVRLTRDGWYLFDWTRKVLDEGDAFENPEQHCLIPEYLAQQLIANSLSGVFFLDDDSPPHDEAAGLVAAMRERLAASCETGTVEPAFSD